MNVPVCEGTEAMAGALWVCMCERKDNSRGSRAVSLKSNDSLLAAEKKPYEGDSDFM